VKNKELELWSGKFGDAYAARNIVTEDAIQARVKMWAQVLGDSTYNRDRIPKHADILEVGAGQGINLIAMHELAKMDNQGTTKFFAVEPNETARGNLLKNCKANGFSPILLGGDIYNIETDDRQYDLVFTSGVLIHIHPSNLRRAMTEVYKKSKHLIICAEYFSPEEHEVNYHGENALWTRDFGSLWLDNFPLKFCGVHFIWKRVTGIDNLTVWVFEKVN